MRIEGLSALMLAHLKFQRLNNRTVVVDVQSTFFKLYKYSNIPYAFGCESDKYAIFVKRYLEKFQKANLTCYFVVKGGHTDREMLDVHFKNENRLHGRNYNPTNEFLYDDIVKPIFSKNIWFQTMDEMGFKYVICNGDYITDVIALALRLNCPVIANNVQYCFSQVEYIPELNTILDENNNLCCQTYKLSDFLNRHNLTEENIITFIILTDQHIFMKNYFYSFFQSNNLLSRHNNNVNLKLLIDWLKRKGSAQMKAAIFSKLSKIDQAMYNEKKTALEKLTQERKKTDTKINLYMTDENYAKFTQLDPDWFEKGVFHGYIAIPYVNLYRFKVLKASSFVEDYEQENSVMLSIDIVKYAFDLLTNFEGGEMSVEYKKDCTNNCKPDDLQCVASIRKPEYNATFSVFENGWGSIKKLKLFEHFLTESLQSFDIARLDGAPDDSKLLIIALAYFRQKRPEAKLEAYSIMLSYVMLGVVFEKLNKNDWNFKSFGKSISVKPLVDSFTDKALVTITDCEIAESLMSNYFTLRSDEQCQIFERKALHPLVEFQRCLEELNFLNQLCGSQFEPTIYKKTYNGTFVYKILYTMRGQDGLDFIKKKLMPAPTVLAFLTGLLEIYKCFLYEY